MVRLDGLERWMGAGLFFLNKEITAELSDLQRWQLGLEETNYPEL